jgi:hypothetical protein
MLVWFLNSEAPSCFFFFFASFSVNSLPNDKILCSIKFFMPLSVEFNYHSSSGQKKKKNRSLVRAGASKRSWAWSTLLSAPILIYPPRQRPNRQRGGLEIWWYVNNISLCRWRCICAPYPDVYLHSRDQIPRPNCLSERTWRRWSDRRWQSQIVSTSTLQRVTSFNGVDMCYYSKYYIIISCLMLTLNSVAVWTLQQY